MSRCTRLKRCKQAQKIGLSHHTNYASTNTYFPQSYSILGSPIAISSRVMPLQFNNKISYKCSAGEILDHQCPLRKLSPQSLNRATLVNITLQGHITQTHNKMVTVLFFFFSVVCCCLFFLFSQDIFRKRFYTRYKTSIKEYQKLAQILSELHSCQTLILNIQDNQLTEQKMNLLQKSILEGMGFPPIQTEQLNIPQMKRHVIIRNYCYFMRDLSTSKIIDKLAENSNMDATFIWETEVMHSNENQKKGSEKESLLGSLFQK